VYDGVKLEEGTTVSGGFAWILGVVAEHIEDN
jgi:hypothetical protein